MGESALRPFSSDSGGIYKQQEEGDANSAEALKRSLGMITKTEGNVWVLVDFYYPKFSCAADHMLLLSQDAASLL